MTDFLTRLAERTLGLSPQVQPLLASRYAPGPDTPVFPDTLVEEQAMAPSADPMQAPVPQSRGDARSNLESLSPRAVAATDPIPRATETVAKSSQNSRGGTNGAGPEHLPASPSVTGRSAPPANVSLDDTPVLGSENTAGLDAQQPVPPCAVSGTHESPIMTGLDALSAESNALPAAESPGVRRSQPVRALSPTSLDLRAERAPTDPFSTHATTKELAPASQSARDHEAPRTGEPHAVSLLLAPLPPVEATSGGSGIFDRPVVERAARRAAVVRPLRATAGHEETVPSVNESGPPVIRVTIGRIEVRAMLPPTPVVQRPAPTRTPQVLSLDDYLKQRSEAKQ